ncbi:hypothetical protein [Brevibacillus sp. AY1]|uniref:hypothetical protein n=1 Tax=Brevibacillus sp. AY1 TaxID=2807621 RepID=UPI002458D0FA|nr:hypothetical protein [Brevibacillus sp. AY1]MDH4619956.1 hypothetical protein [Brevibacillus sp. AY1]
MQKITSIDQFKVYKQNGNGFITITDKNLSKNCVHKVSCYEVKEYHFKQKVITNKERNGSYFFTEDHKNALDFSEKMQPELLTKK